MMLFLFIKLIFGILKNCDMNSKIKLLATGFALSIVFTSCKKEEEAVVSDTPKEIILPRVQGIPTGDYVAPQQPVQQQQQTTTTQVPQPVAQNQVATKPGMNPPHGQAGHRCDIPVGAPLNSKPAPAAQTGTASTKQLDPSMFTTNTSTTQEKTPLMLDPNNTPVTVTEPGMNPPHGQDGHRCDIPVGAALPKE